MRTVRDVLSVIVGVTFISAVPGGAAYAVGGLLAGAVVFSFFYGLFVGMILGVSAIILITSEPERFPDAVQTLMAGIRERRMAKRNRL